MKGTSQLVDFLEKHMAASGFLLGGIDMSMKWDRIIEMDQLTVKIKSAK